MGGFLSALGRIVMAIITLGQYKANKVADKVYTGSEEGVRAGYTELRDHLVEQFNQIVSGVSGIEQVKAQKEAKLNSLNKEEIDLQSTLEGIVSVVENNPNDVQAVNDFNRLDARQAEIDAEQERLGEEIASLEASLEDKQLMLNKIKDEIHDLKQQEEEAVSDLAMATLEERLATQEMGLKKSIDRSGVDAIQEAIREKKARAKTLGRVAGADTQKRMDRYKTQGQASQSNQKLQDILAQRAAVKKAQEASGATMAPQESARKL